MASGRLGFDVAVPATLGQAEGPWKWLPAGTCARCLVAAVIVQTPSGQEATNLTNLGAAVDLISKITTVGAILVGGIWAYFRFVKERTYRPRLEVTMGGQWREGNAMRLLHARVTVKNIGTAVVRLRQKGTGLRIQRLAAVPDGVDVVTWKKLRVFRIFVEHQWIEPGETISDELLINIPGVDGEPLLFETRLVWTWTEGEGNIVVFARQVVAHDASL